METMIATDIGVDLDAGVIKVGMLVDLTGAFAGLVGLVVAGATAYWADVNAKGGVHGLAGGIGDPRHLLFG